MPSPQSAWNKRNPEVTRAAVRRWEARNPERRSWYRRISNGYRRECLPAWADRKELAKIYRECPAGMQVDHVIPVRGKTVCGLHVPGNLQYLTIAENRKKNNLWGEQ